MSTLAGFIAVGTDVVEGLLVEPLDPAYRRQAFAGNDLGGGNVMLTAPVTFGPAGAAWGPLAALVMFDAAIAGNALYSAAIEGVAVAPGQLLTFPAGTYAMSDGAVLDPAVLTVNGVPLTFAGQPVRMT